jgi:two-component system OmpR family response regulator
MRILLVEDDIGIASFVVKGLKEAGYVVEHVTDGPAGLDELLMEAFDAAIIDIMLPLQDGLSVIQTARQQNVSTPVLILSAKASVDDRVVGLQNGGDDYLVKPFAFSELLARLQALIRRANRITEPTTLTAGPLTVDLIRRKVKRSGQDIELQPLEFALLEYLMRNAGRVVSKTMIMEHVWDYNFDPQTNVVEVRICRLRDKIDRGHNNKLIHTVRGVGYVLEEKA